MGLRLCGLDSGFRATGSHKLTTHAHPCRPATQLWSPHRHRRSGHGSFEEPNTIVSAFKHPTMKHYQPFTDPRTLQTPEAGLRAQCGFAAQVSEAQVRKAQLAVPKIKRGNLNRESPASHTLKISEDQ